jgi:hypothetical protein
MYRVDAKYVWFNEGKALVLMYFLNNVPFTFDTVFEVGSNRYMNMSDINSMELADKEKRYTNMDVYKGSSYLISEQAHPCFDEIDIQNPEILPDDICGTNHDIVDYY